jgi:hypothetical protein
MDFPLLVDRRRYHIKLAALVILRHYAPLGGVQPDQTLSLPLGRHSIALLTALEATSLLYPAFA